MKKPFIYALLIFVSLEITLAQEVTIEPKQVENNKIEVYIKNKSDQDQSVKLDCELKGMTSAEKLPIVKLIPAGGIALFTTLTPKDIHKGFGYGTSIQYIEGNVLAKHDDRYVYYLPFPSGKSFKVDQGYLGKQTHMGTYALDFHMDIGTEITAIRGGKVTKVIDKFDKGCPDESCEQFNNLVLVTHDDGTIADYSHLKKNGAKVKVGDRVKPGDLIGLSGDTGWASGPHLHLEVYVADWNGKTSIKANYYLTKKVIGEPMDGETYTQQALD